MELRGSRTGSVLVVALGFIAMLAVMAAGLRTALSTETRVMRYRRAQIHAMSWARAGVYLAMERLAEDGLGEGGTPPAWEVAMPVGTEDATDLGGIIRIEVLDEEHKLDLNTATVSALEHVLGDSALARAIVASRALRPIRRLEELWDLPEISRQPEHQRVILEHGTVWPKAFRIRAIGLVDRPAVGYRIEAVVRRGGTAAQIVEWKEGGPWNG